MGFIQIWRVQHIRTGRGPYKDPANHRLGEFLDQLHDDVEGMHPHPWFPGEPWAEFRDHARTPIAALETEKFGFLYWEQMRQWFDGQFVLMGSYGYLPTRLRVREETVRLGNRQISFVP